MINYKKQNKPPEDYHCTCKYCSKFYRGELIKEDGKYYSARPRKGYSPLEKTNKHLCPGHYQGYQFVIERYTKKGDRILDPCAGSGTALIEALKLGRQAVGVELEFYKILKANTDLYTGKTEIYQGDIKKILPKINGKFDLVVTGTPYNNNSDSPERKKLDGKTDNTFNYKNKDNFAFMKDDEYFSELSKVYLKITDKLKDDGKFVIIIKDPIRNKAPYLLHTFLANSVSSKLKVEEVWIHRHWPPTLFMGTYPKRYPEVKIPLYQTIVVMSKK